MSTALLTRTLTTLAFSVALVATAARAQAPGGCGPDRLLAADAATTQLFGMATATDGTLAAAAGGSDSVTVWRRASGAWVEDGLIQRPGGISPDWSYGSRLAVDGNRVAVRAYDGSAGDLHADESYVDVWRRDGAGWALEATLTPSDRDPAEGDHDFGASLALDGDRLVVGATHAVVDHDSGRHRYGGVYVYEHDGAAWNETAVLVPEEPQEQVWFGSAVALDGTTLVVGAYYAEDDACPPEIDCSDAGLAWVFELTAGVWEERAVLRAPDAAQSNLGASLALDGDRLVAGAPGARLDPEDRYSASGAVYVWERDPVSGEWSGPERIDLGIVRERMNLGVTVGLSGDWLMATASTNGLWFGGPPGETHLWERGAGGWEHRGFVQDGLDTDDFGAHSVLAQDALLVGAPSTSWRSGAVWAYGCPSMMSADFEDLLTEPSALDLRVAPPLDLRLQGNFLVLGWEETMGGHQYQLQVGTLLSLWRDRGYDHAPLGDCLRPEPVAQVEVPEGDVYFLVLTRDTADDSRSSFGRDSFGVERPPSDAPCP